MELFSVLLQEAPADTTGYMILGYSVIFGVILIYLFSLVVRQNNMKKELDMLAELEKEQDHPG